MFPRLASARDVGDNAGEPNDLPLRIAFVGPVNLNVDQPPVFRYVCAMIGRWRRLFRSQLLEVFRQSIFLGPLLKQVRNRHPHEFVPGVANQLFVGGISLGNHALRITFGNCKGGVFYQTTEPCFGSRNWTSCPRNSSSSEISCSLVFSWSSIVEPFDNRDAIHSATSSEPLKDAAMILSKCPCKHQCHDQDTAAPGQRHASSAAGRTAQLGPPVHKPPPNWTFPTGH